MIALHDDGALDMLEPKCVVWYRIVVRKAFLSPRYFVQSFGVASVRSPRIQMHKENQIIIGSCMSMPVTCICDGKCWRKSPLSAILHMHFVPLWRVCIRRYTYFHRVHTTTAVYKFWIIPSPIRKLEYRAPAIKLEYIIKYESE